MACRPLVARQTLGDAGIEQRNGICRHGPRVVDALRGRLGVQSVLRQEGWLCDMAQPPDDAALQKDNIKAFTT